MTTREIAKIKKTFLGYEDHGVLTAFLHVDYGGAQQAIGGYQLDCPSGAVWIARVLKACGVASWEQLPGRTIYVRRDTNGRVLGIGPLPTEPGEVFDFAEHGWTP